MYYIYFIFYIILYDVMLYYLLLYTYYVYLYIYGICPFGHGLLPLTKWEGLAPVATFFFLPMDTMNYIHQDWYINIPIHII